MTLEEPQVLRAVTVDVDPQAVVFAQHQPLEDPPPYGAEVELEPGAAVGDRGHGPRADRIAGRFVMDLSREVIVVDLGRAVARRELGPFRPRAAVGRLEDRALAALRGGLGLATRD